MNHNKKKTASKANKIPLKNNLGIKPTNNIQPDNNITEAAPRNNIQLDSSNAEIKPTNNANDNNSMKLSLVNRKDRYLIVIALLTAIFAIIITAYKSSIVSLNTYYVTEEFEPFLKPDQAFGNILLIACIFLILRFICYCYAEAKTIVNYNMSESINNIKEKREMKADVLFESILILLKHYFILILIYIFVSLIVEDYSFVVNAYKINFIIPICIILIISSLAALIISMHTIDITNLISKKKVKSDLILENVIFVFLCIMFLITFMLDSKTTGKINLNFLKTEMQVDLESNKLFDSIKVNIRNNNFDKDLYYDLSSEDSYFTSIYIATDNLKKTLNESSNKDIYSLNYSLNMNEALLFYNNIIDYGAYLAEGNNKITTYITIENYEYRIVNYVNKSNNNYKYIKTQYEKIIDSN